MGCVGVGSGVGRVDTRCRGGWLGSEAWGVVGSRCRSLALGVGRIVGDQRAVRNVLGARLFCPYLSAAPAWWVDRMVRVPLQLLRPSPGMAQGGAPR